MDDGPGVRAPFREGPEQDGVGEGLVGMPTDRPLGRHAVEAVDHGAEAGLLARGQPGLGYVGEPQLVGGAGPEVPGHEVGRGLRDLAA